MPGDVADLVFTGGVVHTVDAKNAIAQALAVSDGRILALGSDVDVLLTAGPSTERVELGGRALLPGMIEGHGHFSGLGEHNVRSIARHRVWVQSRRWLRRFENALNLNLPTLGYMAVVTINHDW